MCKPNPAQPSALVDRAVAGIAAVQREFDRRYRPALRQAARLKTTEALTAWWNEALACQDIAGPPWATLTHARCTPILSRHVEDGVHMPMRLQRVLPLPAEALPELAVHRRKLIVLAAYPPRRAREA